MTARAMRSPAEVADFLFNYGFGQRAQRLYLHWWRLAIIEEVRTKETACLQGRAP